jgi:integrase
MPAQGTVLNEYLRTEFAKYTRMIFSAAPHCRESAAKLGTSAEAIAHASVADFLDGQREEYAEMVREHRYMEMAGIASRVLGENGIAIDRATPEFRQFCRSLCETRAEAADYAWEVAVGSRPASVSPSKEGFSSPSSAILPVVPLAAVGPSISVGDAIKRYLAEWERSERPNYKLLRKTERGLRLLEWFLTPSKSLHLVRLPDLKNFSTTLRQLPVEYERHREEKTLADVIELGRENGIRPLADNTIAGVLSATRKFFTWAEEMDLCQVNPATRIKAPVKSGSHYRPFEKHHLEKFFSMPVFIGCKGPRRLSERGEHRVRDWRYWIPLIGYFTGARIREICQLQVSDIKDHEGIVYFDINEDGGKSLKTSAARRRVPIHSCLRVLGFLSFVDAVRKSGATSLWQGLPAAIRGNCAHKPGEFFSGLIREALGSGHLGPRTHVFHSFRHTMKDAMRESEISSDVQDALLGHEGKGAGAGYGKGLSLQRLNKEMQNIRMPYKLDGLVPWVSQEPEDY